MNRIKTEHIIEPCKDDSGNWYWAFKVDGEVYADGEAPDRETAKYRCIVAASDWESKQ